MRLLPGSMIQVLLPAMTYILLFSNSLHASDWWQSVKVRGDLRYRHEMIDEEGKDARHRQRLRARVSIHGTVSPYAKIGIQLATGSSDPISTNQTLGDAFSTKPIGLDLAYVELRHDALQGVTARGGKVANPFFKPGGSELMWDSDWNPEGGTVTYEHAFDAVSVMFVGAGLWIEERSTKADSWMGAGQGVFRLEANEKKTSLAAGAGFFNCENIKGFEVFYDPQDPLGNSAYRRSIGADGSFHYSHNYDVLEVFCEANHEIENIPLTIMADHASNTAPGVDLGTGWLVGVHAGKAKKPGSWAIRYIYREVEADAVVGIFTDSDFRGGGTNGRGHEVGGAYQLADNTTFNATYFINEIGLDQADMEGFNRLQIDLQLKF